MNPIYYVLLILISIFSNPNTNEQVRLNKQLTKEDLQIELLSFIEKNFYLIALAALIIFTITCFLIIGTTSTVESGTTYNHLQGVI